MISMCQYFKKILLNDDAVLHVHSTLSESAPAIPPTPVAGRLLPILADGRGGEAESIEWFTESLASRSRMICFLAHPFTPPPSESSTGDTQEDWERKKTADGRGGRKGVGEKPNHTTATKPGPL